MNHRFGALCWTNQKFAAAFDTSKKHFGANGKLWKSSTNIHRARKSEAFDGPFLDSPGPTNGPTYNTSRRIKRHPPARRRHTVDRKSRIISSLFNLTSTADICYPTIKEAQILSCRLLLRSYINAPATAGLHKLRPIM